MDNKEVKYFCRDFRLSFCRGNEIDIWLKNSERYKDTDYVIFDDDSDMLLWQQKHFFKTDNYSGLTPTTCYKAKRYLDKED